MNINLLSILDKNNELKKEQDAIELQKELLNLIANLVKGYESYRTDNKTLIDSLGVKYTTDHDMPSYYMGHYGKYIIKFTKANVKRIQDYLDKEAKGND